MQNFYCNDYKTTIVIFGLVICVDKRNYIIWSVKGTLKENEHGAGKDCCYVASMLLVLLA